MSTKTAKLRFSLSAGLVLLVMHSPPEAALVDRVVGATSGGGSHLVKRFTVPPGRVVVGAEFVTSDLRTRFPRVALLEGDGSKLGQLTRAAYASDVRANGRHLVRVAFTALTIDRPRDVYVAVELPANTGARMVGDGPALGAMNEGHGSSFIASADDGLLQPIDVDLCIDLIFQVVGKQELDGARGSAMRAALDAQPNPFNPSTMISFTIPDQSRVKLGVYSASGRALRSLLQEELPPGQYSHHWNGRDDHGRPVAAGVYIAKLDLGDKVLVQRLVLVK